MDIFSLLISNELNLKKNPLFLSPQPFIKKCGKVN